MGKRYDVVKDLQFGCEMFESKDLDVVVDNMNKFIAFPRENDLNYRIIPIDTSLAVKVIPHTTGKIGEGGILTSQSYHSLVMIYEKVTSDQ